MKKLIFTILLFTSTVYADNSITYISKVGFERNSFKFKGVDYTNDMLYFFTPYEALTTMSWFHNDTKEATKAFKHGLYLSSTLSRDTDSENYTKAFYSVGWAIQYALFSIMEISSTIKYTTFETSLNNNSSEESYNGLGYDLGVSFYILEWLSISGFKKYDYIFDETSINYYGVSLELVF